MISFEPTREQQRWILRVRELVEEEIKPKALEMDGKGDDSFDWTWAELLAQHNLLCPTIPKEYGGLGLSHLTTAMIMEEIASGCAGLAAVVDANMHAASPIILAGTKEQKEKFLPLLTAKKAALAAFALTEPQAGSDVESITTLAVLKGDRYVINGVKDYILNAGCASFYSVFAATNSGKKRASLRAFIIPEGSLGLVIGEIRNKVGIRYAHTCQILLQNVEVPETNVIGKDKAGSGYLLLTQTFDRGRALVGATAVGIARAAFEMALEHARERKQFGKSILANQGISFPLAEMAAKIELARLITWKACWLIDQDQDYTAASSMAKLVASQTAQEATVTAADILGGKGYLAHSWADKLVRDARVLSTIEGTNNVQKAIIASLL